MASKRTVTRRGSGNRGAAKTVLQLSRRAEGEAAKLLKRSQAGTITRVELKTGLKEIDKRLKRMLRLITKLL